MPFEMDCSTAISSMAILVHGCQGHDTSAGPSRSWSSIAWSDLALLIRTSQITVRGQQMLDSWAELRAFGGQDDPTRGRSLEFASDLERVRARWSP